MMKKYEDADFKDLIIETANKIFSRFGFKKTTMNDIARAINRAKSSIYYYFKSKEEIFKSIIEKESIQMRREVSKALRDEDDPEKKLRIYIINRIKILSKLNNYYNALKDEYLEHFDFIKEIREKHIKEEIKIISSILREGVFQGLFDVEDVNKTANSIFLALKCLEYPIFIEDKSAEIEKSINDLLNILFNGIKKR